MDGDFRVARWSGPPAVLNQRVCKVSVRDETSYDSGFLLYVLPGYLDAINVMTSSVTVKHLSSRTVQEIPLPLPPIAEQRRIVAAIEEHFSRLDAAEETLRRADRRLRVLREAILEAAFAAGTAGSVYSLGELASLTDGPFGSNLKTSHYTTSGPRVVRLQNVGEGVFRDERAYIDASHFQRLRKHEVLAGDVVAASLGETAPRACLIPPWLGQAIVKADCIRIRPVGEVDGAFLMWMLNSPQVRKEAATSIKGIGRPRLGLGSMKKLSIPLPPLDEQRRIVAEVERQLSLVDSLAAAIDQALRRSAALRRAILERAFTGKLVPQDPSDEPASVLLERIAAERAVSTSTGRRGHRSRTQG
jgi:type I restriction enzyme S subunit